MRPEVSKIFNCLDAAGTETFSMFAMSLTHTPECTKRILKICSLPGSDNALKIMDSVLFSTLYSSCILEVENKKLYGLRITNEQTDWETGIVDGCDLELYEIKGEKQCVISVIGH